MSNPTYDAIYARPTDEVGHLTTPVLTTGTADANYPVTNVKSFDPARPFLTSSSGTGVDIDFDSGTPVDVKIATIHHHNLPVGTVCHWYRGAAQGATTLDAPFTIGAYPNTGLPLPIGVDLTAASGYNGSTGFRWARLHIPSLAQKIGIGSALLWSAKRQDIRNVLYPVSDGESQPKRVFPTAFGNKKTYYMRVRLRSQPAVFRFQNATEYASFLALWRACGESNAFLWWRDPTGSDAQLCGFPEDDLSHAINPRHDVTTAIEELGCGLALPTA